MVDKYPQSRTIHVDPITRTLNSFAIDLTDNAGLGNLLWQTRGERVEVATAEPRARHVPGRGDQKRAHG